MAPEQVALLKEQRRKRKLQQGREDALDESDESLLTEDEEDNFTKAAKPSGGFSLLNIFSSKTSQNEATNDSFLTDDESFDTGSKDTSETGIIRIIITALVNLVSYASSFLLMILAFFGSGIQSILGYFLPSNQSLNQSKELRRSRRLRGLTAEQVEALAVKRRQKREHKISAGLVGADLEDSDDGEDMMENDQMTSKATSIFSFAFLNSLPSWTSSWFHKHSRRLKGQEPIEIDAANKWMTFAKEDQGTSQMSSEINHSEEYEKEKTKKSLVPICCWFILLPLLIILLLSLCYFSPTTCQKPLGVISSMPQATGALFMSLANATTASTTSVASVIASGTSTLGSALNSSVHYGWENSVAALGSISSYAYMPPVLHDVLQSPGYLINFLANIFVPTSAGLEQIMDWGYWIISPVSFLWKIMTGPASLLPSFSEIQEGSINIVSYPFTLVYNAGSGLFSVLPALSSIKEGSMTAISYPFTLIFNSGSGLFSLLPALSSIKEGSMNAVSYPFTLVYNAGTGLFSLLPALSSMKEGSMQVVSYPFTLVYNAGSGLFSLLPALSSIKEGSKYAFSYPLILISNLGSGLYDGLGNLSTYGYSAANSSFNLASDISSSTMNGISNTAFATYSTVTSSLPTISTIPSSAFAIISYPVVLVTGFASDALNITAETASSTGMFIYRTGSQMKNSIPSVDISSGISQALTGSLDAMTGTAGLGKDAVLNGIDYGLSGCSTLAGYTMAPLYSLAQLPMTISNYGKDGLQYSWMYLWSGTQWMLLSVSNATASPLVMISSIPQTLSQIEVASTAVNASSSLLGGIANVADDYINGLVPYLPGEDSFSNISAYLISGWEGAKGDIGSSETVLYMTSLPATVFASLVAGGSQAMTSAGSGIATGWDTTLMMLGGRTNKVVPQNIAVDYDLLLSRILESDKFKATVEQVARLKTEEETLKIQTDINQKIKEKTADMSLHQDALNKFDTDYNKKLDDLKLEISAKLKETTEQLIKEQLTTEDANTLKINEQTALLSSLKIKYESLLSQSEKVTNDMSNHQGAVDTSQGLLQDQIAKLQLQIQEMEKEQVVLRENVTSCCKNNTNYHIAVEQYINDLLKSIIQNSTGENSEQSGLSDFSAWINNYFVAKNELEEKLQALSLEVKSQTMKEASTEMQNIAKEEAQNTAKQIMNIVSEKIKAEYGQRMNESVKIETNEIHQISGLSEEEVSKIVRSALIQYDADKTGMFDYALETAGGSVISTRCTETFVKKTAMYSLFGIPIWYPSNNPRTIIQPGVQPGECWAFKGSQGFVVIQLAGAVIPTRFSMEHIPKSMSPNSNIDSAPKDFMVYGLKTEKDKDQVLLGRYKYDDNKDPLQIFEIEHHTDQAFPFIELDIISNYGNGNYTCLYRFRVHGVLQHDFEG